MHFIKSRINSILSSNNWKLLSQQKSADPFLILRRFSRSQLISVARLPCPIENPEKSLQAIQKNKLLRRDLNISEIYTCSGCQFSKKCPKFGQIPKKDQVLQMRTVVDIIKMHCQNINHQKQALNRNQIQFINTLNKLTDNVESISQHHELNQLFFQNQQSIAVVNHNQKIKQNSFSSTTNTVSTPKKPIQFKNQKASDISKKNKQSNQDLGKKKKNSKSPNRKQQELKTKPMNRYAAPKFQTEETKGKSNKYQKKDQRQKQRSATQFDQILQNKQKKPYEKKKKPTQDQLIQKLKNTKSQATKQQETKTLSRGELRRRGISTKKQDK